MQARRSEEVEGIVNMSLRKVSFSELESAADGNGECCDSVDGGVGDTNVIVRLKQTVSALTEKDRNSNATIQELRSRLQDLENVSDLSHRHMVVEFIAV